MLGESVVLAHHELACSHVYGQAARGVLERYCAADVGACAGLGVTAVLPHSDLDARLDPQPTLPAPFDACFHRRPQPSYGCLDRFESSAGARRFLAGRSHPQRVAFRCQRYAARRRAELDAAAVGAHRHRQSGLAARAPPG